MNKLKNIWTTITGSISSILPLFFAVCKPGGACAVACASPIASLFGISSASLAATPLMKSLYPLLLVISAVSFTISYYKLYVLPKYAAMAVTGCNTDCACDTPKNSKPFNLSKSIFWIGLTASVVFFSYFEYQNYKINSDKNLIEHSNAEEACCAEGESCE
jgi:hypothetical protein